MYEVDIWAVIRSKRRLYVLLENIDLASNDEAKTGRGWLGISSELTAPFLQQQPHTTYTKLTLSSTFYPLG